MNWVILYYSFSSNRILCSNESKKIKNYIVVVGYRMLIKLISRSLNLNFACFSSRYMKYLYGPIKSLLIL